MATVAIDIRLLGKQRTGDEQVFFGLTKELVHNHPEHRYVLLTDKKEDELAALSESLQLSEAPADVELISFGPVNRFRWNGITLPLFFFRRKDIAVFHTQYILPFILPDRLKVVAHIHDISFARYPEYIGRKDLLFLRSLIPHTCRRADLLAVPSQFTKREVMEVYSVPEEKIVVIPNALGEGFLAHLNTSGRESFLDVRDKYTLPEHYFLYVGTLQPRKNIPYLLEIFAEYKKEYPNTEQMKLVLVGNRNAHHFDTRIDEALERFKLQDEVVFPGYVDADDLPRLYQGATTFIFPSLYEGFGIPLLEALAAGVATMASDIPVHREVGGEAVTYFPLSSVVEGAKILYTISITEQKKLPTPRYSWAASADLLARMYQKISRKY